MNFTQLDNEFGFIKQILVLVFSLKKLSLVYTNLTLQIVSCSNIG